jgi:hypothetical protein
MIQNPSILDRPSLSDIKRIFPRATGVAKLSLDLGGLAILFNRRADFFRNWMLQIPLEIYLNLP